MNNEDFVVKDFPLQRVRLLNNLYNTEYGVNSSALSVLEHSKCFIAGGAITSVFTNNIINDYDIYFPMVNGIHNESYENVSRTLCRFMCYCKDYETDFAQTFTGPGGIKIQLIKLYNDLNIYDVLHKFDFTVCMGAYSLTDKKFILDNRFLINNSSKELIFNDNTDFPIASLIRTIKYQRKGYTISGIQMMMIAMAIQNIEFNSLEEFREHIQGIDQSELLSLTNQFRNNTNTYNYTDVIEKLRIYLSQCIDNKIII